jgi:hypothetical protein
LDAILEKVQSAKGETIKLTVVMVKKNATVDLMDYVGKPINVTIPDEKE